MNCIEAYMWLLFAHFIGDWALQPRWIGENKGNHKEIMFAHCMIYTACIAVALRYIGIGEEIVAWSIYLFFTHYIIDKWKCWATRRHTIEDFPSWHLYVDHYLHFMVLVYILYYQRNDFLLV